MMLHGRATAELAQDALMSLVDGVTLANAQGRLALINPRVGELFGLDGAFWLEQPIAELYDAIAQRTLNEAETLTGFQNCSSRADQMPQFEFTLRQPQERIIQARWFALHGEQGADGAYGVVWRDVTRDKELEQLKTQLLATVSHELRTPLASIKGFATTLLRQDVRWEEATQRDFLRIIEDESDRLEELINNLLDMSQVEAGALRMQSEAVQLRRVVREAVEQAQRRTDTHWFVMDMPAELPRVWADPRRVRQVLNNLLENAIKYAPQGGQITVTCEVQGGEVLVGVADQGMGIPPEQLDRIFDRFFQGDSASTRKIGGSGLGLAISKGIIEAHKGRLWVESRPGEGSVFRFTLPIASESNLLQT